MVGVSSWPLSTILIFDLGIVPRVWWIFVYVFVYHLVLQLMTEIKSVARIQTLTLLASARANPPPSKIITPHGTFRTVVCHVSIGRYVGFSYSPVTPKLQINEK